MTNKRIIRSIAAVISLFAILLSLVACNAKPIDNFKKVQQESIDKVINAVDECYEKAKAIILEHREVLDAAVELLLEKEKITREEFEALFVEN